MLIKPPCWTAVLFYQCGLDASRKLSSLGQSTRIPDGCIQSAWWSAMDIQYACSNMCVSSQLHSQVLNQNAKHIHKRRCVLLCASFMHLPYSFPGSRIEIMNSNMMQSLASLCMSVLLCTTQLQLQKFTTLKVIRVMWPFLLATLLSPLYMILTGRHKLRNKNLCTLCT